MGSSSLTLAAAGIVFHRLETLASGGARVQTCVSDCGYLVGVSLGHDAGRQVPEQATVWIRRLEDPHHADFPGPMDFLLLEIPHSSVVHALGRSRATQEVNPHTLECVSGVEDPVIASLARAVVSVLERPAQASRLFMDHLGTAIITYLLEKYGGSTAPSAKTSTALPRHIEAKAKDMLRARLDGSASVAAIAEACALSRSYFIRAFRESTGTTPHQWLTRQRLAMARSMLSRNAATLADIATSCGFSDQSHFTRAFTAAEGVSPGVWRKRLA